jgi:hypothetical protein
MDTLTDELAEAAGDFSSAGPVNHVMGKVFHALAADRISTRKAGVLCYIAQTILHSARAMALQKKLDAEVAARKAAEEEKAMRPDKLP